MIIQQKLKSITKRLNKNLQKNKELLNKIDDIFDNINKKNESELMVMLTIMLIKSKEVFFCDKENNDENSRTRVLREYLKVIIKRMSRSSEYKSVFIKNNIEDGQYSFFEVICIVHKQSTED